MKVDRAGYAPKEFARLLDKGEATVYRWIKNGTIKAIRFEPQILLSLWSTIWAVKFIVF